MDLKETTSITDIVNQNVEATRVLEGLAIEYWSDGHLTISEVALLAGCKVETLMDEFKIHLRKRILDPWRLDEMGLTGICRYLRNRHHSYAQGTILLLNRKLRHICNAYGSVYPELQEIEGLFRELAENLLIHIEEEEQKIFPLFADLDNSKDKSFDDEDKDRIASMFTDLSRGLLAVNRLFNEISHLSNTFSVPFEGDQIFHLVYSTLKEFAQDHHLHMYVENHLVLGKIKEL